MQRRLILRLAAIPLALLGYLLYQPMQNLWNGLRSPCAKAWGADDLAAVMGGQWERRDLYHCDYFCNESFGPVGAPKNTAFIDVNKDIGSPEADGWEKELTSTQRLDDVVAGMDSYQRRVFVLRRKHGAVRLELDSGSFTDAQASQLLSRLRPKLAVLDNYLSE